MRAIVVGIKFASAALLIGAALLVAIRASHSVAAVSGTPESITAPAGQSAAGLKQAQFVGAGSCAARACHGNIALSPGRQWNSAYSIWMANDPHAQSYAVLSTNESQRMATALGIGDPTKAQRCLACHAAPVSQTQRNAAGPNADAILIDGVGCEACHGAAENYLAAHTMRGWEQLGDARYSAKFGMKNTADIDARAKVCVGCHVGQPDADGKPWRDVNHDLIAAGHPRLNFDFAAYMATLPPHWNTEKNPQ
ncbi:MAG TPA: multiheme c-type cytochrome, partial [Pirellulales bacterium]